MCFARPIHDRNYDDDAVCVCAMNWFIDAERHGGDLTI